MSTSMSDAGFLEDAARLWWIPLIGGIAWLVFGVVVLQFDLQSLTTIGVLTGLVILVAAADEFMLAWMATGWRWAHAVLGVLFVGAGVAALSWPGRTALVLAVLISWYLLFKGIFDIVSGIALRHVADLWWLTLIVGIAQVALAVWAVGFEGRSVALLLVWVGAGAIARGITELVIAFRLRSVGHHAPPPVPA
jgi:uncharacterized membrane protein HdeD (DUF308 family)